MAQIDCSPNAKQHDRTLIRSLLLLLLLTGCSERERTNPLDPRNPQTHGRPAAPRVLSFDDSVQVRWQRLSLSSITAYRLYRRLDSETGYTLIAELPPDSTRYIDTPAAYDVQRYYRLSAATDFFESPLSDSVAIRPGPSFVWAIDASNREIVKFTHDGRYEIFRAGTFLRPISMDVDQRSGSVFVTDSFLHEIAKITQGGFIESERGIPPGLSKVVVDSADGGFWIANSDSGTVSRYAANGALITTVRGFGSPVAMALHTTSRHLWVLDKTRGEIDEIQDGQIVRRLPGFNAAYDIALNSHANLLWVADSNFVVRVHVLGSTLLRIQGFKLAARLAVNETTGDIWVADWTERFGNSKIFKLSSQGQIQFTVDGISEPLSLSVNTFNGHCFLADTEVRGFVELDADGRVIFDRQTSGALSLVRVQNLRR